MKYISYSRCQCGAVTVQTDLGTYSCLEINRQKFFPGLDLRKIRRFPNSYCCDHCVNHYGLDLCGCGSGEAYGKCDNELEECQLPMQKIGEYERVTAANSWLAG